MSYEHAVPAVTDIQHGARTGTPGTRRGVGSGPEREPIRCGKRDLSP